MTLQEGRGHVVELHYSLIVYYECSTVLGRILVKNMSLNCQLCHLLNIRQTLNLSV